MGGITVYITTLTASLQIVLGNTSKYFEVFLSNKTTTTTTTTAAAATTTTTNIIILYADRSTRLKNTSLEHKQYREKHNFLHGTTQY